MPNYVYEDTATGKTVELQRTIADRDNVPANLKRISVPQSVGFTNHSGLREPGADVDVPRAFREYELSGVSCRDIEKKTGFSRTHIRRVWDF